MPTTLNAETSTPRGELTESFDARVIPRWRDARIPSWRDVRNYLFQLIGLTSFFGLGLGITVVSPFLRLAAGRRAHEVGQKFVRFMFRWYAGLLEWGGLFRIHFEGQEKLEKLQGAIIAPNHPGLLDAIFLIGRMPRAVCVMRADLMRNPCFAGAAWLSGFIRNDRGAELIRQCQKKIEDGDNLLIFPEGTRTRAQARGVNPFKSGFALAAVLTGAPIQTVFIERSGIYLGKESSLATAARLPIEMSIRTGDVFHARPGESAKQLSARLETYFRARLASGDDGIRLRS
jgi:1-acyl-sn-glycerol-3-phosphate acyltransferase